MMVALEASADGTGHPKQTSMKSPTTDRYVFIDSLRGLAACSVVLFHLNVAGSFPPGAYQSVVKHGWLGVTAFFVISGFAVNSSVMRSTSSGPSSAVASGAFIRLTSQA